jgi:hypothetical protein
MPSHWREWLGTIRAEQMEDCDFFVLAKMQSRQAGVLDSENQELLAKVWAFYRGLLLVSRFAAAHKPVILTGARETDEIGVRQTQDLEAPADCIFRGYPDVSHKGSCGTRLFSLLGSGRSVQLPQVTVIGDCLECLHSMFQRVGNASCCIGCINMPVA